MIALETGVEVPEEVRGISIAQVDEEAPLTFYVGQLVVRPRYRHNFGASYSRIQAMADLRRAIRTGDADPDTPVPAGGSTRCHLEESTEHGFAIRGIGCVLCSKSDQYSRPAGRARSLKRALIQLARQLANADTHHQPAGETE